MPFNYNLKGLGRQRKKEEQQRQLRHQQQQLQQRQQQQQLQQQLQQRQRYRVVVQRFLCNLFYAVCICQQWNENKRDYIRLSPLIFSSQAAMKAKLTKQLK